MMGEWRTYLVLCADGTLYCGVTTDIRRRIEQHNSGKGAKYTRYRSRRPVKLAWLSDGFSKVDAYREEWRVKHITRLQKLELIAEYEKTMQIQLT